MYTDAVSSAKPYTEFNSQGNKAADTVKSLENQLQMQRTQISSRNCDRKCLQTVEGILVAEMRDREEVHQ